MAIDARGTAYGQIQAAVAVLVKASETLAADEVMTKADWSDAKRHLFESAARCVSAMQELHEAESKQQPAPTAARA